MPSCPVCNAAIDLEKTPTVPFCSDRCRLIDLGRWLDEAYAVPEVKRQDDEDDDVQIDPDRADGGREDD